MHSRMELTGLEPVTPCLVDDWDEMSSAAVPYSISRGNVRVMTHVPSSCSRSYRMIEARSSPSIRSRRMTATVAPVAVRSMAAKPTSTCSGPVKHDGWLSHMATFGTRSIAKSNRRTPASGSRLVSGHRRPFLNGPRKLVVSTKHVHRSPRGFPMHTAPDEPFSDDGVAGVPQPWGAESASCSRCADFTARVCPTTSSATCSPFVLGTSARPRLRPTSSWSHRRFRDDL